MSAHLTTDSLNQWLSVSSLAAVIVGVPPEVALGALAGAVIFVTSAVEYPIHRRVLLSMLSFLCGLLFYKPAASILIGIASLIPTITQDSLKKGLFSLLAHSCQQLSLCVLVYGSTTVQTIHAI